MTTTKITWRVVGSAFATDLITAIAPQWVLAASSVAGNSDESALLTTIQTIVTTQLQTMATATPNKVCMVSINRNGNVLNINIC